MVLFRFNQLRKVVEKIIARYISDKILPEGRQILNRKLNTGFILDPTTRF